MSKKARSPSLKQLRLKDNPSSADLKKTKSPARRLIDRFQSDN